MDRETSKKIENKRIKSPAYIIIGSNTVPEVIPNKKVAVFVHFFYEASVKKYSDFLNRIPSNAELYVISPKTIIQNLLEDFLTRKFIFIHKANRGRDISALLISAKHESEKYEYICFIHDKKEKSEADFEDAENWNVNFWTNMIGKDEQYISQVINYFEDNPQIGLLIPHAPLSARLNTWDDYNWGINRHLCEKVAKLLNLSIDLDERGALITYGTVFWARRRSLEKLLEYGWKYSDFPEEPLPDDGTISHAIERMLGYIAFDSGYDTEIIISSEYINNFVEQVKSKINNLTTKLTLFEEKSDLLSDNGIDELWLRLKNDFGVGARGELDAWEVRAQKVLERCREGKKIYVYGNGDYALEAYLFLKKHGIIPKAFLNDSRGINYFSIQEIPIISLEETIEEEKVIIIAVPESDMEHVIEEFRKHKILDYEVFNL